MRRARLPKAQPKILDGGRRSTQPQKQNSAASENIEKQPEKVIVEEPKSIQNKIEEDIVTQPPPVTEKEPVPAPVPEAFTNPADDDLPEPVQAQLPTIPSKPLEKRNTPKEISEIPTQEKGKEKRQYTKKRNQPPPEPDKMRLMDYIFFNPTTNPMPAKPVENRQREEDLTGNVLPTLEEENVDNPDGAENQENNDDDGDDDDEDLPGPRVTIGPDGQITIDERSLVIKRTQTEMDISQKEIVYETSDTNYKSFRKSKVTKRFWTDRETAKFYKILSVVGTDFTLMENMFPEKTRADLKNKYKKEERVNSELVNRALSEWQHFDVEDLEEYLKDAADSLEEFKENKSSRGKKRGGARGRGGKRGRSSKKKNDGKNLEETNEDGMAAIEKRAKAKRPRKRHRSQPWSDEEDLDETEDICECCAIKTRTTKRQNTLSEKRRVVKCESHMTCCGSSSDSDRETVALDSEGEPLPTNPSMDEIPTVHISIDGTTFSEQTTLPYESSDDVSENNSPTKNTSISKDSTIQNATPLLVPLPSLPHAIKSLPAGVRLTPPLQKQMAAESTPRTSSLLQSLSRAVLSPPFTVIPSVSGNSTTNTPRLSTPTQNRVVIQNCSLASPVRTAVIKTPLAGPSHATLNQLVSTRKLAPMPPSATVLSTIPRTLGVQPSSSVQHPMALPAGQLVVVASKTPNSDQQVLHIYLVSPQNQPSASTPSTSTQEPGTVPSSPLKALLSAPARFTSLADLCSATKKPYTLAGNNPTPLTVTAINTASTRSIPTPPHITELRNLSSSDVTHSDTPRSNAEGPEMLRTEVETRTSDELQEAIRVSDMALSGSK